MWSSGTKGCSLIRKSLKSSESPGFAHSRSSRTSKSWRRRRRRRPSRRRRKRRRRRLSSPRKKSSPRKRKTRRRKRNRMPKKKTSLTRTRRKSILSTYSPNLPSTSTTGRESSATLLIEPQHLANSGASSTTKAGLSGRSNTSNTRAKALLAI